MTELERRTGGQLLPGLRVHSTQWEFLCSDSYCFRQHWTVQRGWGEQAQCRQTNSQINLEGEEIEKRMQRLKKIWRKEDKHNERKGNEEEEDRGYEGKILWPALCRWSDR